MRRLTTLALLLAVLAALWAGGWFALASWAEGRVGSVLAEAAERGLQVDCSERDVVGFPFSLRVACGATEVTETGSGSRAAFSGLTGGASIFAPRTASVALEGPAEIAAPFLASPGTLHWTEADVDVGMGMGGPQSVSFDTSGLSAHLPFAALPDAAIAATDARGTLTPASEGGTDAEVAFNGLILSGAGASLPPLDGVASGWLSVSPRDLAEGGEALKPPLTARGLDIRVSSGAARLFAAGDLAVDAEGILDGKLTLTAAGVESFPELIAALPEQYQRLGNAVTGGLFAFGQAVEVEGEQGSRLVLEIEEGRTRVGPISVDLPRLPL